MIFQPGMKSSITIFILVLLLSWSCSTPKRMALPEAYLEEAEVVGMPGVRDWGDEFSELFQSDMVEVMKPYSIKNYDKTDANKSTVDILAISGGGGAGAFGVGLLNGWTDSGDRPEFMLVTGISTGALIAPFAFLGSEYDQIIKKLYTTMTTKDVFTKRSFFDIIGGSDSIADSSPLAKLIRETIDEEILRKIAETHNNGRRLFIGTTNLDARRLVVWNMGKIATYGTIEALELFRNVMLASASIPVVLPPVYIEVQVGTNKYDEMHVDGGVNKEVFFYGFMLNIEEARKTAGLKHNLNPRIFIIRNNQFHTPYKQVKRRLLSIAARALAGITTTQGIGDLYRIYLVAQRDGIEFNQTSIPHDYVPYSREEFDPVEMNRLYNLGYKMAINGYHWDKYPPFFNQEVVDY